MASKVYMIGNAHIDPVWLWKKPEGLSEIKSTFRSALDRMKEFPGFVFTSACAGYYAWIERVDPAMFEEIRERVKEGRWAVAGGFWVQPDCNIPSGESFARHALYSQRYFEEKLGVTASVGYNVDSFGHNGMLPQLLRQSGMTAYIFMRPGASEKPELPAELFEWESPDGSRVTAARINLGYAGSHWDHNRPEYAGIPADEAKVLELLKMANEQDLPFLCFYGVGNHGGGPTIRTLKELERVAVERNDEVCFSGPNRLFEELSPAMRAKLPVVCEDLQHHASGCYAANAPVKTANRRAENALYAAEKYDLLATRLLGGDSVHPHIEPAWRKVLFNQFHDILAGCSIREAYEDALNAYGAASDSAREMTNLSVQRISWKIKTTRVLDGTPAQKNGWISWEKDGEGAPVVLFNPHSFPVEGMMKINLNLRGAADPEGNPLPLQRVRGPQTNGGDRWNTLIPVKVPAFGYATYYLYNETERPAGYPAEKAVRAETTPTEVVLENARLRVAFDRFTGCILSFYDKDASRELCAGPMARPVVIDDHQSDTWSHARFTFQDDIGVFSDARLTVVDEGPMRASVRVESRYNRSTLVQDFVLDGGEKTLRANCRITFGEALKLVKLSFPVAAAEPEAVYSMPYGFIAKPCDGREEPSHEWMKLGDKASGEGLALLNDSKYSFSAVGGDMRMIIARGSIFADHFGERDQLVEYMDQGEQAFAYALTPCGADVSGAVREASVLNLPLELVMETHHDGDLPPVFTGMEVSVDNVIVQSAKYAEDASRGGEGADIILRLYETAGRPTEATVNTPLFGEPISLTFRPQEIKTIRLSADGKQWREVNFLER